MQRCLSCWGTGSPCTRTWPLLMTATSRCAARPPEDQHVSLHGAAGQARLRACEAPSELEALCRHLQCSSMAPPGAGWMFCCSSSSSSRRWRLRRAGRGKRTPVTATCMPSCTRLLTTAVQAQPAGVPGWMEDGLVGVQVPVSSTPDSSLPADSIPVPPQACPCPLPTSNAHSSGVQLVCAMTGFISKIV